MSPAETAVIDYRSAGPLQFKSLRAQRNDGNVQGRAVEDVQLSSWTAESHGAGGQSAVGVRGQGAADWSELWVSLCSEDSDSVYG